MSAQQQIDIMMMGGQTARLHGPFDSTALLVRAAQKEFQIKDTVGIMYKILQGATDVNSLSRTEVTGPLTLVKMEDPLEDLEYWDTEFDSDIVLALQEMSSSFKKVSS